MYMKLIELELLIINKSIINSLNLHTCSHRWLKLHASGNKIVIGKFRMYNI